MIMVPTPLKILFPIFIHPPPIYQGVFFFKYIYIYIYIYISIYICCWDKRLIYTYIIITPKSYYLIMLNNKVFNVSLITTFNDLHTYINFIFKKFDRFHPLQPPFQSSMGFGSAYLKTVGSTSCFINSRQKCWDIYYPSLFCGMTCSKWFGTT